MSDDRLTDICNVERTLTRMQLSRRLQMFAAQCGRASSVGSERLRGDTSKTANKTIHFIKINFLQHNKWKISTSLLLKTSINRRKHWKQNGCPPRQLPALLSQLRNVQRASKLRSSESEPFLFTLFKIGCFFKYQYRPTFLLLQMYKQCMEVVKWHNQQDILCIFFSKNVSTAVGHIWACSLVFFFLMACEHVISNENDQRKWDLMYYHLQIHQ